MNLFIRNIILSFLLSFTFLYGAEIPKEDKKISINEIASINLSSKTLATSDIKIINNYAYVVYSNATGNKPEDGAFKIINIKNHSSPTLISMITLGSPQALDIVGKYAYIANGGLGLNIIDISNPSLPILTSSINSKSDYASAIDVEIQGDYAYIAFDEGGLEIINISNPSSPIFLSSIEVTNSHIKKVKIVGKYAYLIDRFNGFKIVDVSNPSSPILINFTELKSKDIYNTLSLEDIKIENEHAYILTRNEVYNTGDWITSFEIKIIDITNPSSPIILNSIFLKEEGNGGYATIDIVENHLYTFHLLSTKEKVMDKVLNIRDIINPSSPILIVSSILPFSTSINSMKVIDNYLYITTDNKFKTLNVNNSNQPPILKTKSITPNKIKSGENITFTTTWDDPENKSVVDVKVRYRKQGSSDWTTNVMSHKSGYTFEKEKSITGAVGIYDVEFMAKDADTPSGERTNDTGWLDGGSFEIEADTVVIPPVVVPTELPTLSLNKDINFGKSKSRSLNVTNKAKIKLEVKNATEVQVNFDGVGSYEDSKTITSDGVYEFSYLFNKSDYTSDSSDFWKKDLTFTATAYNDKGASNVVTSGKFTIYDLDEYHEYLAKKEAEATKLFEEKKRKEEEKLQLEKEKEDKLKEKLNLNKEIEDVAKEYSDKGKEDLELLKDIDIKKDCAWLKNDGTCQKVYKNKDGEYSYIQEHENDKYKYTIKIVYSTENSDSYFPAYISLESDNIGKLITNKPAQNPKHLKILVNQLIEKFKNKIDSQIFIDNSILEDEQYSSLLDEMEIDERKIKYGYGYTDPVGDTIELDVSLDNDKKSRLENAFSKSWETWSDEIYDAGLKAGGSLSLVFDSDIDALGKIENLSRATYQVSLGTLKAIYGALGGLIYGAGEEEIKEAYTSVKDYTQEEFNKLDIETQAQILDKIDKSVKAINTNKETKASFELLITYAGSNARILRNASKSVKAEIKAGKITKSQLARNIIITSRTTVLRSFKKFKILLKSGKLKVHKGFLKKTPKNEINLCKPINLTTYYATSGASCIIVPTFKGFINRNKILSMDKFNLYGKEYTQYLDDLIKNGDPKGDLVENIAKIFLSKQLKEYKLYDGMYSGNQGFDMIYIKGTIDNIEDMIIIEAKQISKGGTSKLTFNKNIPVTQMTDEWIGITAKKLSPLGGNKLKIADYIDDNLGNVQKIFISVGKNPKNLETYKKIIMGKINF